MGALPLYIIFEYLALVTYTMPERQRGDNRTTHVSYALCARLFHKCSTGMPLPYVPPI